MKDKLRNHTVFDGREAQRGSDRGRGGPNTQVRARLPLPVQYLWNYTLFVVDELINAVPVVTRCAASQQCAARRGVFHRTLRVRFHRRYGLYCSARPMGPTWNQAPGDHDQRRRQRHGRVCTKPLSTQRSVILLLQVTHLSHSFS